MQVIQEWTMNCFPPSLNNMYPTSRAGHRFLSSEGKAFKNAFELEMNRQGWPCLIEYADHSFSLIVEFYWSGWFTKDGKLWTNRDVSNRYKAIEDAIFKKIQIDDSRNILPLPVKRYPEADKDQYIKAKLIMFNRDEFHQVIAGDYIAVLGGAA